MTKFETAVCDIIVGNSGNNFLPSYPIFSPTENFGDMFVGYPVSVIIWIPAWSQG